MIDTILIRNWKGHRTFMWKFENGLNFIIGPNGIGKSSILEAIYFGITGSVKSGAALKKMKTINSEDPMIIQINILKNKTKYRIERIYNNNTTTHTFYNLTENYSITGKNNVEKKIRNLYSTKNVFLKKTFYYGEGDIFKVISSSKGKFNFKDYIEDYLGIEKLKEFQEIIRALKSKYSQERKDFDYEVDQMISLTTEQDISIEKNKLIKRRDKLKEDRKTVEKSLAKLKSEYSKIEQWINHKDEINNNLEEFINLNLFDYDIVTISKRLKAEIFRDYDHIENMNEINEQESKKLEIIEERVNNLRNIVNVVEKLEEDERSKCPVCERPFDKESYDLTIRKVKTYEEDKKLNDKIKSNLEKLHFNYQNSKNILKKKEWILEELGKISSGEEVTLQNYENMNKKSSEMNSQIENDTSKLNELKVKIDEITDRQLKLTIHQKKKEAENYLDESDIQNKRTRLNKSIFLTGILEQVIDETLYDIKLEYLQPLTQKISEIWKMIFNDDERIVSFDPNLNPILKMKDQKIGFENLSGGEKTILTIITKTLIMNQFSNIDFIVLDEPLEHLDIINRAQIIEFLFSFFKANLIDQIIITTFEESLTRNLIDTEDVSIISLGSLKKYPQILEKE